MRREQIIFCQDINWEKVEDFFAEISGIKPEGKVEEGPLPPELSNIADHIKRCEECRGTLVELRKKYGITKGVIFPKEGEKQQKR